MPTGQVIANRMNLSSRSRVSALLRNALPDGEGQAEALLDALGAASYEKEYAVNLYRTIQSISSDDPDSLLQQTRRGNVSTRDKAALLEMRVHRAVFSLPYIPRDAEEEVRRYLRDGHPVLLVGPSMVGKTRLAAMLITAAFADRECLIPETKEELARLGAAHVKTQGTVILLDNIERLLGTGGITQAEFYGLAERNAIFGTIREREYDGYIPTNQLRPLEWDVLSMFSRVFLDRRLSPQEEERLRNAVDDAALCDRIIRTGIGEYVGAAEYVAEALRTGLSANPPGHALVLGAADWARTGMRRPVPTALLRELAMPHLAARYRTRMSDASGYEEAIGWATREINSTVSLLQPEEHDCFSIFDYALDLIAARGDPVPDTTWPLAIANADPSDLIDIGRAAMRDGRPRIAEQAWRAAEGTDDLESAAFAALNLGDLFSEQGDTDAAQAAYERAIRLWDTQAGPVAAVGLGTCSTLSAKLP
jgi:hypothetical protein